MFQNDDAYIDYMELRDNLPKEDHKASFSIKINIVVYFREGTKPSSCKNIKIKIGSDSENRFVAVLDQESTHPKVKTQLWHLTMEGLKLSPMTYTRRSLRLLWNLQNLLTLEQRNNLRSFTLLSL